MDPEAAGLSKISDELLIKMWRDFAISLSNMTWRKVSTENVVRRLRLLEQELDTRGIGYGNPYCPMRDRNGNEHVY